ncbi:MAG: hypothetical protein OEY22_07215 [Candidatus Bathyarchaeota archaeon]|nr:hypothetical protein [Candidatus Bathyarchaeota archaeon]MDH5788299.1 hypothetical protein [Candidatus Bathyarchaeota archaeon]
MSSYFQGETVSKLYEFTDKNNAYFDPDTINVKIINPSGGTEATPTLTKVDVGKHELNYALSSDAAQGIWTILIEAIKGSYTKKDTRTFEVVAPPA